MKPSNENPTNASITDPKRTANSKLSTVSLFEHFLENWFPVWQAGEKKCNVQLPKQPANSAKIFVIVLTRHITLHTAHTKRNAKKTFWLLIHCGRFCIICSKKLLPINASSFYLSNIFWTWVNFLNMGKKAHIGSEKYFLQNILVLPQNVWTSRRTWKSI